MATRKQRKNKQNRTKGKRRVQKGGFFGKLRDFFRMQQKENSESQVQEQSNNLKNENEVPELQKQETMGGKRRNKRNNK